MRAHKRGRPQPIHNTALHSASGIVKVPHAFNLLQRALLVPTNWKMDVRQSWWRRCATKGLRISVSPWLVIIFAVSQHHEKPKRTSAAIGGTADMAAPEAGERMASFRLIERSSKGILDAAFPPAETLERRQSANICQNHFDACEPFRQSDAAGHDGIRTVREQVSLL